MPAKETDAISVVMPAELFPARPTSCGLPVVNVDVCILGDNGQKLPPGGVGEICFRGATVMQEQPGRKSVVNGLATPHVSIYLCFGLLVFSPVRCATICFLASICFITVVRP